jgi:hypothetical protein
LHPSLRPIPPCPTSQVSMRVYEEHRKVGHINPGIVFVTNIILSWNLDGKGIFGSAERAAVDDQILQRAG